MENKKLAKWTERLLDTGKRNNLINFRESKIGYLECLQPDFSTMIKKIAYNKRFEIYEPDFSSLSFTKENPGYFDPSSLTKESFYKIFSSKLKQNQLLMFNKSKMIVAAAKDLERKARSAIEENGINILYMAFGFMEYTDANDSKYVMQAPLLLVPVSIERPSAISPIYLTYLENELIVNPALIYKLKNDYNITLEDIEDKDVFEYIEYFKTVVEKLRFNFYETVKVGTFSFSKINMYEDLKENEEMVLENENIQKLLQEEQEIEDRPHADFDPNETKDEKTLYNEILTLTNVVDADSSQGKAILEAKLGKSFVLQGPPGTGKSQTITNIIAEFLYEKKSVLFVSAKMAALDVVYKKLTDNGLKDFCLELHSHKANKRAFIQELADTLRKDKTQVSRKADLEEEKRIENIENLNKYEESLHKVRDHLGMSLYDLFNEISSRRFIQDVDIINLDVRTIDKNKLDNMLKLLNKFVHYSEIFGINYNESIWYGVTCDTNTFVTKTNFKNNIEDLNLSIKELLNFNENQLSKYNINIYCLDILDAYKDLFKLIGKYDYVTSNIFKNDIDVKILEDHKDKAERISEINEELLKKYKKSVFKIDVDNGYKLLTTKYRSIILRLFMKEYKEIYNLAAEHLSDDSTKIKYIELTKTFKLIKERNELLAELEKVNDLYSNVFGSDYKGFESDFDTMIKVAEKAKKIKEKDINLGKILDFSEAKIKENKSKFYGIYKFIDTFEDKIEDKIEEAQKFFDKEIVDLESELIHELKNKLDSLVNNIENYNEWLGFVDTLKELKDENLQYFVDKLIKISAEPEHFIDIFKKAFYTQCAEYIIQNDENLSTLDRKSHDELVKEFIDKDNLLFKINKARIHESVSSIRPDIDLVSPHSSVGVILREANKKSKQKSIRSLLQSSFNVIQEIKPCFLMSPLSVSTYLPPNIKFDLVIFDEASQIFPEDSLGSIYRGKQLIVVGDSKQMPPTNFFNATVSVNEDDDTIDDDDISLYDSILDLSQNFLDSKTLKWHYRSKFEDLIAFSNKNFYKNCLITFPSIETKKEHNGVDFYYLKDGVYNRQAKRNEKEAQKVVDLIVEHIKNRSDKSLGVVAFNVSQQNYIDDLLLEWRKENPQYEDFFSTSNFEPFFVKNLETVQGDERDVIIFSVSFAKDQEGRFILNFGPVNKDGGERRLNVAFSRAKYNVKLVSSIRHHDIDLTKTNSRGVKLLKEYLDFAENGINALNSSIDVNDEIIHDSEFEEEVYDFLTSKGYCVDTQVGCSSYRIDLAVKYPDSSRYVLAIECDGASYHSSKTARDRDRLRQEILERNGWKFYRIWSTDWFRKNKTEKANLIEAVENAFKQESKDTELNDDSDQNQEDSFVEVINSRNINFEVYKKAEVDVYYTDDKSLFEYIKKVVDVEAPINVEYLYQRVAKEFYNCSVTTQIKRNVYRTASYSLGEDYIIDSYNYITRKNEKMPLLRIADDNDPDPRHVRYIHEGELILGMIKIIENNISITLEELFKFITNLCGFKNMGSNIREKLQRTFDLYSFLFIRDGDKYSIDKEKINLLRSK